MTAPPIANAGVHFPPPALFVGGIGAGWLLDRYVHALPLLAASRTVSTLAWVVIAAALLLMISGVVTFRRAGTAVIPHLPASRLVQSGPYRFTRNPMYTGFTIAYLGVTVLLRSAWPLLLLPVVLALLVKLVIRREEAYLASAFGAAYDDYRARVRRWL